MRRIQVLIENYHYQYLHDMAHREGKAVSALLREMIDKDVAKTSIADDPLYQAGAIVREPGKGGRRDSETIDHRLYGGESG